MFKYTIAKALFFFNLPLSAVSSLIFQICQLPTIPTPGEKVAILPILGREWEHAAEGAIMYGYLGVPCLKLDSVCIRIQKA